MKSVEQLTVLLEKEEELAEKHRKKAADIRKQIELYRCDMAQKKLNSLNLSGSEYDKVMSLLSAGKHSVLAAASIVLGTVKEDAKEEEKEQSGKKEMPYERKEDFIEIEN